MADLERYRRHIHEETPRLVRWTLDGWVTLADTEPWLSLPPDLDQDYLPQLLRHLADAALAPDGDESRRKLLWAAIEHGVQRRRLGFGESLIHTEYQLLRRTLWSYLRDQFPSDDSPVDAILRIDAAITLASSGSLLGYHKDALEAAGRWPEGAEKVLADWSLGDARP